APTKCWCIAGVHWAEWTKSPLTVSGHRSGYSARTSEANRPPSAVAALVIPEVVNIRINGWENVVRSWTESGVSTVAPSVAPLPPSQTNSGFIGQTRGKETDVVLKGDKSPAGAIAL